MIAAPNAVPVGGGGNLAAVQAALEAQLQVTTVRRELFVYEDAKEKSLLNRRTIFLFSLYVLVVGSVMGVRLACFSLMIPTPHPAGTSLVTPSPKAQDNMWNTDSHIHVVLTYASFTVIMILHLSIVLHLKLRTHEKGLRLMGYCAWVFPIVFWLITSLFYLTFISLSRYGVSVKDISAAGTYSFLILIFTMIFRVIRIPIKEVLGELPPPNAVDNPLALAAAAATTAAAAGNVAVAELAAAAMVNVV
ncbi:hypothetical protein ACP4OV_028467 [Aristida adscensionis]